MTNEPFNHQIGAEAIDFSSKHLDDPKAIELLKAGLKDRFYKIRNYTLTKLDFNNDTVRTAFEPLIEKPQ